MKFFEQEDSSAFDSFPGDDEIGTMQQSADAVLHIPASATDTAIGKACLPSGNRITKPKQ